MKKRVALMKAGQRRKLTISLSDNDFKLLAKRQRETGAYTMSETIRDIIRAEAAREMLDRAGEGG